MSASSWKNRERRQRKPESKNFQSAFSRSSGILLTTENWTRIIFRRSSNLAAAQLPQLSFSRMQTLVECVPNFSEGRDKAKVDAIVDAMKMDGVFLLDREMDADHNRCVITIAGDRDSVGEAAIRGVGKAAELIDLNHHQGAHPRLGAADVVPFIPIEGVSLEDCVAMARHVGEQIWKRYQIPVYLYEAAATTPDRQNLENIRRGQFEGIRNEIASNPARKPDIGEAALHPSAGACVVGARKFLIAYNIFLNTGDVEIAKKVAKAVRFSGGGLRFVKAAGFLVRGQAQVSMNLTDFEQTPLHRVFEAVKSEAGRYGASPQSSEIVGLIPKKALEQSAEWFLQIENFDSSLILENRLACVMGGRMAVGGIRAGVEPFIEQLAAPTATPGGGSAAAAAGAMAAGLAGMVATMSRSKKACAQYEGQLSEVILRLARIREDLKSSIDADAESFQSVMEAFRQAKGSASAEGRVDSALKQATNVPLAVAERASEVLKLIDVLGPITSRNMRSDLVTGAALARAAVDSALANVEINLESLHDTEFVAHSRARASALKA